jgi:chromosomal replication initiation ATPase DnaA
MGIMGRVAKAHGFRVSDIRLHNRHRKVVAARRAVAAALDAHGLSSTEIGDVLYRDHSTVLNLLGRTGVAKVRTPQPMQKQGRKVTPWHARGYTKPTTVTR